LLCVTDCRTESYKKNGLFLLQFFNPLLYAIYDTFSEDIEFMAIFKARTRRTVSSHMEDGTDSQEAVL